MRLSRQLDSLRWQIEVRLQVVVSQLAAALTTGFCAKVDVLLRRAATAARPLRRQSGTAGLPCTTCWIRFWWCQVDLRL